MIKIPFSNLPNTTTPVNATNLNAMQDNVEDVFNGTIAMGNIVVNSVNSPTYKQYHLDNFASTNYPEYYLIAKLPKSDNSNRAIIRINGQFGSWGSRTKIVVDFFVANRDGIFIDGNYYGYNAGFNSFDFVLYQDNDDVNLYLRRKEQYTSEVTLNITLELVTYYGETNPTNPIGNEILVINQLKLCTNNYSFTELKEGFWVNGKPLYRQSFSFTGPTPGQETVIAYNLNASGNSVSNIDEVVNYKAFYKRSDGAFQQIPIVHKYMSNWGAGIYDFGPTTCTFWVGDLNNSFTIDYLVITIEYTKTTD